MEDKGVHTFPKGICPKVNVIARLEYELAYYDSAVHRFNTINKDRQRADTHTYTHKHAYLYITDYSLICFSHFVWCFPYRWPQWTFISFLISPFFFYVGPNSLTFSFFGYHSTTVRVLVLFLTLLHVLPNRKSAFGIPRSRLSLRSALKLSRFQHALVTRFPIIDLFIALCVVTSLWLSSFVLVHFRLVRRYFPTPPHRQDMIQG